MLRSAIKAPMQHERRVGRKKRVAALMSALRGLVYSLNFVCIFRLPHVCMHDESSTNMLSMEERRSFLESASFVKKTGGCRFSWLSDKRLVSLPLLLFVSFRSTLFVSFSISAWREEVHRKQFGRRLRRAER